MQKLEIMSPLPGTFYRKPSPDAPPYKSDGDSVEEGDVVGLVEVMKNFHEIKARDSGVNIKFLLGDADPVQPGQAIASLDK
mgnify:CR=1 FL=1